MDIDAFGRASNTLGEVYDIATYDLEYQLISAYMVSSSPPYSVQQTDLSKNLLDHLIWIRIYFSLHLAAGLNADPKVAVDTFTGDFAAHTCAYHKTAGCLASNYQRGSKVAPSMHAKVPWKREATFSGDHDSVVFAVVLPIGAIEVSVYQPTLCTPEVARQSLLGLIEE